jgi:hypothetical protein
MAKNLPKRERQRGHAPSPYHRKGKTEYRYPGWVKEDYVPENIKIELRNNLRLMNPGVPDRTLFPPSLA